MHFAPWSACGTCCLDRRWSTDQAEGVVVILAKYADPIIVLAAFATTTAWGFSTVTHSSKAPIVNKFIIGQ